VKWALENRIYEGHACSIQAATLVMGDLGSTIWSCVIAAHTFTGLALGKHWPRWVVYVTVIVGWTLALLLTIVPAVLPHYSHGPFFSIAGTWCFYFLRICHQATRHSLHSVIYRCYRDSCILWARVPSFAR